MNNIVDLDRARAERSASSVLTIALDDALYAFLPHHARRWKTPDGRSVRYMALSNLPDGIEPDINIGQYVPSAPGRQLLLQSISGIFEIDAGGRVHRDGDILWSEPLAAYGIPRLWLPGQLRVGQEAALLFVSREDDGLNFRIVVTGPVLITGRQPMLNAARVIPSGWLEAAVFALPRRVSEQVRGAVGTSHARDASPA